MANCFLCVKINSSINRGEGKKPCKQWVGSFAPKSLTVSMMLEGLSVLRDREALQGFPSIAAGNTQLDFKPCTFFKPLRSVRALDRIGKRERGCL